MHTFLLLNNKKTQNLYFNNADNKISETQFTQ
jgi:hypothetical protein